LIAALSTGDPEHADRAMRQHIRHGLDNIIRAIGPNHPTTVLRVK
jgi:DNA-binding GntR family transcriptional regulator